MKTDETLIRYCLENLLSTNQLVDFAGEENIKISKSGKKEDKIKILLSHQRISLDVIHSYCLKHWKKPDINMHLRNLKSGILKKHSWNGMMPSTLHQSFQSKVRQVCSGEITLESLIKTGEEVAKHEYFIVAIADLCEHLIVTEFKAIPSIINRGISDFVFNSIPYDLKNTNLPNNWSFKDAVEKQKEFILNLINGADVERIRKQAQEDEYGWKNNRFYIVTLDENVWLTNPEVVLGKVKGKIEKIGKPININVNGNTILTQIIFID